MSCQGFHVDVLGGLVVAAGFMALLFGFFRGLRDLRERESLPLLAFALGIAAIAAGSWVIQAC